MIRFEDMHYKPVEYWQQDAEDATLWHGPHGLMVNSVALDERRAYYEVIELPGLEAHENLIDRLVLSL